MARWVQRVLGKLAAAVAIHIGSVPLPAEAQMVERFTVDQRGDFVLVGNTLARDCAADPELLLAGSVGTCGANDGDSGIDVFWSVGADASTPVADISVTPEQAASIAVLELPDGASVTRAELYWSARAGAGDTAGATFGRGAAAASISAARTSHASATDGDYYQSVADVTALVQQLGAGPYRLSGIDAASPIGLDDDIQYAAWWLVVFYALGSEPVRHLALYDGFAFVTELTPASATLTGFEVPIDATDGKLGVVAFDGDVSADGDQLRFGAAAPLGAEARLEASDNFFDGSRRDLSGAPLAGAEGDRPRASGAAGSLSGLDLHVVDVGARLAPGQTTAEVLATTSSDGFFLSGLVLSVATTAPDLSLSSQSVRDVNGPPLRPGDELEYTIVADNVGTGAAPIVTLRAPLPALVSYLPGSLEILDGASPGFLSDAADADRGELEVGAVPTLVMRLGAGADGTRGGRLAAGESSSVRFRVVVDASASGSIVSQAQISVERAPGSEPVDTLTDASPDQPGANPTAIAIDDCAVDSDCSAGLCDVGQSPQRCVECLGDADCSGLEPSCDASRSCTCVPREDAAVAGDEVRCDGKDDDCDGSIDEGLAGVACNAGSKACPRAGVSVCDGAGGVRCEASAPARTERCGNGADDDCDGAIDAADDDCALTPAPIEGASSGAPMEAPSEGASAATEASRPPRSSTARPPVPPRQAPPAVIPVAGDPSPALDPPSAATLGGGGGCQLAAGHHRPGVSSILLGVALLVRRWRRALVARRASTRKPQRDVGSPPTQTVSWGMGAFNR